MWQHVPVCCLLTKNDGQKRQQSGNKAATSCLFVATRRRLEESLRGIASRTGEQRSADPRISINIFWLPGPDLGIRAPALEYGSLESARTTNKSPNAAAICRMACSRHARSPRADSRDELLRQVLGGVITRILPSLRLAEYKDRNYRALVSSVGALRHVLQPASQPLHPDH